MSDWKGRRLYVELSASQVRKRLKGVGLGVRKVESADKNRAVIIHTATGDHERDLKRMFTGFLSPEEAAPAPDSAPDQADRPEDVDDPEAPRPDTPSPGDVE